MVKADKLKASLIFDVKKTFVLVTILLFSVLSLFFILIISGYYIPLSRTLANVEYVSGTLYRFLPLAFMMSILFISKLNKVENENTKRYTALNLGLTTLIAIFSIIVLFRVLDIGMMLLFSSSSYSQGTLRRFASISFQIIFFFSVSLVLLLTSGVFFKKNGLQTFFPIYIIPAFYSFNADLIMRANLFDAFSFFYPAYQFILEFGKIETMLVGALLNLLNFNAVVSTGTFPFRLILRNAIYSIDLPCIGWEGIMGYSIIFLNLLLDLENNTKMRLIWGLLGLIGTIFVNIFRLTLIFIMGELFNVQAALLIHQNIGDFIFIIWIFLFIFLIDGFKKGKFAKARFIHAFEKVQARLNLK